MGIHERFLRPLGGARTLSKDSALLRSPTARRKPRRGCGTVARRRARRYVTNRCLPKSLWPILAAFFFVVIVFDRPLGVARAKPLARNSRTLTSARSPIAGLSCDAQALPSDTGAELNGAAALQCRPPVEFHTRHAAQVLAFLIRNRGKLDTDVVREKWKYLDGFSLPLAVYLRGIEAREEWAVLEREISKCPLSPAATRRRMPSSLRQRKILELTQEWQRRGEELLTVPDGASVSTNPPEHRPDDDDAPAPPTR